MSCAGKCPLHTHLDTRKWVIINKRNGGKWSCLWTPPTKSQKVPSPRAHLSPSSVPGPPASLRARLRLVTPSRYQCSHPSSVPWLCFWAYSHHTEVSEFLSLTQGHSTFVFFFFKDPHLGRFHTVIFLQYPSMFILSMWFAPSTTIMLKILISIITSSKPFSWIISVEPDDSLQHSCLLRLWLGTLESGCVGSNSSSEILGKLQSLSKPFFPQF